MNYFHADVGYYNIVCSFRLSNILIPLWMTMMTSATLGRHFTQESYISDFYPLINEFDHKGILKVALQKNQVRQRAISH